MYYFFFQFYYNKIRQNVIYNLCGSCVQTLQLISNVFESEIISMKKRELNQIIMDLNGFQQLLGSSFFVEQNQDRIYLKDVEQFNHMLKKRRTPSKNHSELQEVPPKSFRQYKPILKPLTIQRSSRRGTPESEVKVKSK